MAEDLQKALRAWSGASWWSNPAERMNAEDILNHPWVREDGDAPDTPLDNVVMNRMKKFTDMNRFKKVGMSRWRRR